MNEVWIYVNDKNGTIFKYSSKREVVENFLWDICDIARLGGVSDIHELENGNWLSHKEIVENSTYFDGNPLISSDKNIWLQERFATILYYLKEIAEDGLRNEDEATILVNPE